MPTPCTQPDLNSDNGTMLTVGITAGTFEGALVFPVSTDGTASEVEMCQKAVEAFQADLLAGLLDLLSSDAEVSFIEARGMVAGNYIPFRHDYEPGDQPGTRAAGLLDGQVAPLLLFYSGGNAPGPKGKLQVGKNFLFGASATDVTDSIVGATLVGLIDTFAHRLANGFTAGGGAPVFYRVCSARETDAATLPNVVGTVAPELTGTQRRRIRRN